MKLSVVTEDKPSGEPEYEPSVVAEEAPSVVAEPKLWFRRGSTIAGVALIAAAVIAAFVFTNGRANRSTSAETSLPQSGVTLPAGNNKTIKEYINENGITSRPVRRAEAGGDPGAPVIGMGLLPGGTRSCRAPYCSAELLGVGAKASGQRSLAAEASEWAYGAVQWASSVDSNDPPTMVVLLDKLTGDVDPAKILEYAPGELKNLPNYEPLAEDDSSNLSGYDAVQLVGRYTIDGKVRSIGQKTVVIPARDATYVLQIIVDSLEGDAEILARATGEVDARTVITP